MAKKSITKFTLFLLLFFVTTLNGAVQGIDIQTFEKLRKSGVKVVDIRKENVIKKTGMIPGSFKLNFYKKDGTINKEKWLHQFVNIVKDRTIKFVLISTDGQQAETGAKLLCKEKKYCFPYYLEGGFDTWIKHKKPIQHIK